MSASRQRTKSRLPIRFLVLLLATASLLHLDHPLLAQEDSPGGNQTYLIGVADELTISVWKSPDLSAQVPVRPDGMITLPLVGEVLVAGQTPGQVRETLNQRYAEFVSAPTLSVVVNKINSRRIYILGEVAASGAFDIVQPLRVMQALALAGGLTEYAKKDQIVVLRQKQDREERLTLSIKDIANGRKPADNIPLLPGDTIIVP